MTNARGHAVHLHVRGTNVEAWAENAATCLEELAIGVAQAFADPRDGTVCQSVPIVIESASLESQALQLAREVVELAGTLGVVPVTAELVEDEDGTLSGFFDVVTLSPARLVDQLPRRVVLADGLSERRRERWGPSGETELGCEVMLSS
jgi:hypothetical protein